MQKKLLTVAVASALAVPAIAVAQSTTEVYGTVNMAFGQFRYTDGSTTQNNNATTVGASASKWDVANGASNYGVRSRENLGGGSVGLGADRAERSAGALLEPGHQACVAELGDRSAGWLR
jgi:hypothetical protein